MGCKDMRKLKKGIVIDDEELPKEDEITHENVSRFWFEVYSVKKEDDDGGSISRRQRNSVKKMTSEHPSSQSSIMADQKCHFCKIIEPYNYWTKLPATEHRFLEFMGSNFQIQLKIPQKFAD